MCIRPGCAVGCRACRRFHSQTDRPESKSAVRRADRQVSSNACFCTLDIQLRYINCRPTFSDLIKPKKRSKTVDFTALRSERHCEVLHSRQASVFCSDLKPKVGLAFVIVRPERKRQLF